MDDVLEQEEQTRHHNDRELLAFFVALHKTTFSSYNCHTPSYPWFGNKFCTPALYL